jgi:hypothetical protein
MGVLMLCLASVIVSAIAGVVRVRSRRALLTRETESWVRFLQDDLGGMINVR